MNFIKHKFSRKRIIFVLIIYFGIVIVQPKVFSSSFCSDYAHKHTPWFEEFYNHEWDEWYEYCKENESEFLQRYRRDRDNFFPLWVVDSFKWVFDEFKDSVKARKRTFNYMIYEFNSFWDRRNERKKEYEKRKSF